MLQKIMRTLATLNSLVFLLIFAVFGAIVYGYVAYRLFDEVDHSLQAKAEEFLIVDGKMAIVKPDSVLFDPRIFILLRDTNGLLISLYPSRLDEGNNVKELAAQVGTGPPVTKRIHGHIYRVYSQPYRIPDAVLDEFGEPFTVRDIIAIGIVDSETALLKSLLIVIGVAMSIGILLIISAGFYLARRALVPIRNIWKKQQQFVADASHELRTPLTIIKSNAELVLRHPGHSIQEESIRITNIVRESVRMNKLISTLLTLARADGEEAELNKTSTNVNQLIQAVVEQFQPLADLKGLALTAEVEGELVLAADKDRLHQLMVIILDNAIKYTTAGQIVIRGRLKGTNVQLQIIDSGHGILPEDIPHIFDRFYRVDKARSREEGGIGLGLSIAEWIVHKHEGKIKVESTVGQGTCFTILLPVNS
ncbi:ATP-binding protein [Anaerospora sp.]|uniref:sensor histidine kinase n=1 Tax=Anaerospora sp. TaxID=1960278 RepID=UPI00289D4A9E|nr:ATP-binding protein [Anaerospora sp.]